MKDDNYTGIILEEVRDQYAKILEGLEAIQGLPQKVDHMQNDMDEVKSDLKVVKAAVTDQSEQINSHEQRITTLEAA